MNRDASYYTELKEIAITTHEIVKTGDLETHRDAMRETNQRMLDLCSKYDIWIVDVMNEVVAAITIVMMEKEGLCADDSLLPTTH